MRIELFNGFYFMYLIIGVFLVVGLFFLLRKRSDSTKKIVIMALLVFNLALHFLKLLNPPYAGSPTLMLRYAWFTNICAVNVLVFPFIFRGKNKAAKDFMVYLGFFSGLLAIVYPVDTLHQPPFALETIRFFTTHILLLVTSLLPLFLKMHQISYKNVWKMPLYAAMVLLFIMVQQVIQSELGIVDLRDNDFFNPNYQNSALVWGITPSTDPMAASLFSVFTPNFMKVVPWGLHKGEPKYWPFFWLMPSVTIYGLTFPFIFILIFKASRNELFNHVKRLFRPKYLKYKYMSVEIKDEDEK